MDMDPYIRLQLLDHGKTEAQRREDASGRGSGMIESDQTKPVFRPHDPQSKSVDRQNFNQRWMREMRDALVQSSRRTPTQEYQGRERSSVQPERSR